MRKLIHFARSYFLAAGIDISDVNEMLSKEHSSAATQFVQTGIDTVNHKAVSRAQFIQKWTILSQDFSIVGGKLGKCH